MKRKAMSAGVYGAAALALTQYLASVCDGCGEPSPGAGLVRLALTGTILLVLAGVFSCFSPRIGTLCGIAGCAASWPCFAVLVPAIPWQSLEYSSWSGVLVINLALIVSFVYSVRQLRALGRNDANLEGRMTLLKVFAALLYPIGIFAAMNWQHALDWFYRLRYGT